MDIKLDETTFIEELDKRDILCFVWDEYEKHKTIALVESYSPDSTTPFWTSGLEFSTGNNGIHCHGVIEGVRFDFWTTTYKLTITCQETQRKTTVDGFGKVYSTLLTIQKFMEEEEEDLTYDALFKH